MPVPWGEAVGEAWGESARLRARHPHEPWLWRRDWAERAVRDSAGAGGGCLWGFAILWNLICAPFWFLIRWEWPMEPFRILTASFPIAGALLLGFVLYRTLRRYKYGRPLFRIDRSPIPLGSTLRGELEVRLQEPPPAGFALRLANVRRTASGLGKNRSVTEFILWQDEQTVTHGVMRAPDGLRVPVRFDLPWECEPAELVNGDSAVIWRLHVSAEVPGIDYEAAFELPVFRTGDARDELAPAPHSAASWQPPREITLGHDRVVIRSAARPGDWIGHLVFFTIWYGALFLFRRVGAPGWVLVAFGAFAALFVLVAFDILLGRTTLTATRQALTIRRTWLGIGLPGRSIPAGEIVRLEERIGVSVGTRAYHAVRAVLRDGRACGVARHIPTRRDAQMLAAKVARMLGV